MIKELKKVFLSLLPTDGSTVGNTSLRRALEEALAAKGQEITEEDYWSAHAALMEEGFIATGKGRGGSVKLIKVAEDDFSLQAPVEKPADPAKPRASKAGSVTRVVSGGNDPAQIISYRHPDKRVNNPEVGMVNTATDPHEGKNQWAYDPHIDPALQFDPQRGAIEALIDDALASGDSQQMRDALEELKRLQSPYLNWTGKAERTSFEIDTVSLHVHERIDPASILAAVRKAMQGDGKSKGLEKAIQPGLFEAPFESLPLRDAIDFYRHERGWANRLAYDMGPAQSLDHVIDDADEIRRFHARNAWAEVHGGWTKEDEAASLAAWQPQSPEDLEPIHIHLGQMAVLLPSSTGPADDAQFVGEVVQVTPRAERVLDVEFWRVDTVVIRADEDVAVPIYVAEHAFEGDWRPEVGQYVTGSLWLQAYARGMAP